MRKLLAIPGFVLLSIGSVFVYFGLRIFLYPQLPRSIQGGLGVTVLGVFIATIGILLVISSVFLEGRKKKPPPATREVAATVDC